MKKTVHEASDSAQPPTFNFSSLLHPVKRLQNLSKHRIREVGLTSAAQLKQFKPIPSWYPSKIRLMFSCRILHRSLTLRVVHAAFNTAILSPFKLVMKFGLDEDTVSTIDNCYVRRYSTTVKLRTHRCQKASPVIKSSARVHGPWSQLVYRELKVAITWRVAALIDNREMICSIHTARSKCRKIRKMSD